jgi:hypothetical protein
MLTGIDKPLTPLTSPIVERPPSDHEGPTLTTFA